MNEIEVIPVRVSTTGFASLDIEIPQRGEAYRFVTARGDLEITTQYVDTTEYDWAGTHIFDSFDGLFGHSSYDNWCYFPPAGAAATSARQTPPRADAPLPRPRTLP